MIINKYKRFIVVAIIVIITIISITIICYINAKPSVMSDDVVVEGILQPNNSPNNTYKEYLLNINMVKTKDCHMVIYPYIEGIGYMSFSEKDGEDYYKPGSIGNDGITEPIAINELKSKSIIEYNKDISLVGFWFPDNAGQYKSRIYFDKLDTFKEIKNPTLVCVYREKKYGKELTWIRSIPIKIE